MPSSVGKNTAKVLDEMGEAIVQAAQRNLGTRRIGKNKSYGATKRRSLADSLEFTREGTNIAFGSPKPYANFIHWGVSGTQRKVKNSPFQYKSKMPPIGAIMKWMKVKPVRLRDKDGKFIKQTTSRLKSAAYMIARSIKRKGIPKLAFFTEAWETQFPKWKDKVADAIALDTLDDLLDGLTNDNFKPDK